MKSAYLVLGVTVHASSEEIRAAYLQKARNALRQEADSGPLALAARQAELKAAFELLSDPEQRAAHDLALTTAHSTKPAEVPASIPRSKPGSHRPAPRSAEPSPLKWVALATVAVVIGGVWLNNNRLERIRAQTEAQAAAAAIALQKEQADAQAAQARLQAEAKAQQDAERKAAYQERILRSELEQQGRRIQAEESYRQVNESRRMALELQEARRLEAEARASELRRQMESRRIVETEKRQIRELCMQNYGRPNC